jgi:general secretion pathway protein E
VKDAALAMVRDSGLAWSDIPGEFRQPKGCDACNLTGFRGRILVTETIELTPEISSLLQKTSDPAALQDAAVSQGMVPLSVAALRRAGRGETSLAEVVLNCAASVPARTGN